MKNKRFLSAMGLIDDKYIEEAVPAKSNVKKRIRRSVIAAIAAVAMLSVSLWLFIPFSTTPPDVSKYQDDEYYKLISTLNEATFVRPRNKNNFEKYVYAALRAVEQKGEIMEDAVPGAPTATAGDERYVETTDNQVAGVIEADLIKRSDKYIYYLSNRNLSVYTIAGEDSRLIGSYALPDRFYWHQIEFYLSNDCNTVTVIGNSKLGTEILSLDVSDAANITEKASATLSGEYLTSRLTEGKLLILSNYYAKRNADYSVKDQYIPNVTYEDETKYVPSENIYLPENLNGIYNYNFVVVAMLDESTLETDQMYSFFTYYTDAYVSNENVYLARNYYDRSESENNVFTRRDMSEIARLSYTNGLVYEGSAYIPGSVLNQYSLDEKDGILRAVTTVRDIQSYEARNPEGLTTEYLQLENSTNASLYCINITTMDVISSVEKFAPKGESVRSVRFDGDSAYVCTAIFVSDPVFFFDLSDINNITYKETDTIEGFSTSLVNFGDGYLLGIGTGDGSSLKIEVYREGVTKVLPVCKYEIESAGYSEDYKSYFIDRENALIGLGVSYGVNNGYSTVYKDGYILLHFNGQELIEVVSCELIGDNYEKRAVLTDGFFYMLSPEAFKIEKVPY